MGLGVVGFGVIAFGISGLKYWFEGLEFRDLGFCFGSSNFWVIKFRAWDE